MFWQCVHDSVVDVRCGTPGIWHFVSAMVVSLFDANVSDAVVSHSLLVCDGHRAILSTCKLNLRSKHKAYTL